MLKAIRQLFRTPTSRELLQRQLEDAKRERTFVSMERERYEHSEAMLVKRIRRIETELRGIEQ